MIRVTRFRLGSEMRGERHWMDEDKRKCRICGWKRDTWKHVLEQCVREVKERDARRVEEILSEYGRSAAWMKKLKERKRGERTGKTEKEGSGGKEGEL